MNELSLPEKFLILAHHPEKKRFRISEVHLKYGLVGALLLEMSADGSLELKEGRIVPGKQVQYSTPSLATVFKLISKQNSPGKIKYWIRRLSFKSKTLKWQILSDLEKKRIIRVEQLKFLGVLPYRRSHLLGKKVQYDLIREARAGIAQQGYVGNEELAILGLIQACRMQRILSRERTERKIIAKKLTASLKESPVAEGVDQTIRQVHAAILGAVAASGAAASAATRH